MADIPIVERAYQLARSGEFANCSEIAARLKLEGHVDVRAHLDGQFIKSQLLKLCQAAYPAAQAQSEPEAPAADARMTSRISFSTKT